MLHVGLLQCDHVNESFRDLVGDYPDLFRQLFQHHAEEIDLQVYDVCHGELPAHVEECDAYLSTGSRYSVYDDVEWIHRLSEFVRQMNAHRQKFVGVCFGHQMIAHALGGKVAKSDRGWGIGVKPVYIDQVQPWMQPSTSTYHLLLSHQDQVLELPPDTLVIGGNEHCPYSMIEIGEHFLGIQAHPEFTKPYAEALMRSRMERIGEQPVHDALQSLEMRTDESVIADWIVAFLTRE